MRIGPIKTRVLASELRAFLPRKTVVVDDECFSFYLARALLTLTLHRKSGLVDKRDGVFFMNTLIEIVNTKRKINYRFYSLSDRHTVIGFFDTAMGTLFWLYRRSRQTITHRIRPIVVA